MASGGQSGLTAVVFTDLVGSTELRSRLGEDAADALRRAHDEALAAVVGGLGGTVVKGLGDGLMATFGGATEAVSAAVGMQQAIVRVNRRVEGAPLALRVGVSAGDVRWDDGDCFGEPVIEASRLCAAAEGGKILCSDVVRALGRGGAGHEFTPIGPLELKGLPGPVGACEVGWAEPAPDFPLPAALRTRAAIPFVGRVEEREALRTAWKRAVSGERAAVLMAGEPGVGKTRLASELAVRAHGEGALVLAGRCDEEGGVPYQPFFESLRHFLEHCPPTELAGRLGRFAGDLERLVPGLSDQVPGLPDPLRAGDDAERYRLFDAVASWLAAASVDQPVLLVLDDLHWADKPTLLALRHLLRSEASRLLVIGTYRDTDLDRTHPLAGMLAELRRQPGVERIDLRGLTVDEVVALLESAAGHEIEAAGLDLARGLHSQTEGNPFFVEEVLAHLIETGALYAGDDGRWTSDLTTIEDFGIPEGVREVVGRRLSRLSGECNRILGQAAVLGAEFDVGALRAMAAQEVVDALEDAERTSLIAEVAGDRPAYAFTHALVRQTLLDELSVARRQQYHVRAAESLEQIGARPGAVALHYRQAGAAADPEKAVAVSILAAEEARRRLAWEDASDHWEAALELLEVHGGDPADRARLIEQLGDVMYATGRDWERGIDQLERAVDIYESLGDRYRAAKVRSRIGRNLSTFPGRVDTRRAIAHLDVARPVLEERGDSPALAYLEIAFSTACTYFLGSAEGLDAARRAAEIGERLGRQAVVANARLLVGWHQVYRGEVAEGAAALGEAYEDAVRLGQPILAFLGAWMSAGVDANLQDPTTGLRWLERELASGRLDGAPALRTLVQTQAANMLALRGDLDRAHAQWRLVGPDDMGSVNKLICEGSWDEAADLARQLVDRADERRDEWVAGFYRWNAARCEYFAGDLDAAEESVLAGLAAAGRGTNLLAQMHDLPVLARILHAGRRGDEAKAVAARADELAARFDQLWGFDAQLSVIRGLAAESVAEVDAHFTEALAVAGQYGIPWTEAEIYEEWALKTARPELVDGALEIYERIGAGRPWIERARGTRTALENRPG